MIDRSRVKRTGFPADGGYGLGSDDAMLRAERKTCQVLGFILGDDEYVVLAVSARSGQSFLRGGAVFPAPVLHRALAKEVAILMAVEQV